MNDRYRMGPWLSKLEKERGDLLEKVQTLVNEAVCSYANGQLSSSTRNLRILQDPLDKKLPKQGTKK